MIAAFVLFLREGLEASLIVSLLFAALRQLGMTHQARAVWIGVGLAVLGSLLGGVALYVTIHNYAGSTFQSIFETITYLVAVVLLTTMTFWMQRHSRSMKKEFMAKASAASSRCVVLGVRDVPSAFVMACFRMTRASRAGTSRKAASSMMSASRRKRKLRMSAHPSGWPPRKATKVLANETYTATEFPVVARPPQRRAWEAALDLDAAGVELDRLVVLHAGSAVIETTSTLINNGPVPVRVTTCGNASIVTPGQAPGLPTAPLCGWPRRTGPTARSFSLRQTVARNACPWATCRSPR